MGVTFDTFGSKFVISMKGKLSHKVETGTDPLGNLQWLHNALEAIPEQLAGLEQKLFNLEH